MVMGFLLSNGWSNLDKKKEEDEGGGGGRQTREKQEEEEEGEEEEEEGQGEKEVKCIFLLCWLYTGAYSPQSHLLDCHVLGGN